MSSVEPKRNFFEKLFNFNKKHEQAKTTNDDSSYFAAQSAFDELEQLVRNEKDIKLKMEYQDVLDRLRGEFKQLREKRSKKKDDEFAALLQEIQDEKQIFVTESQKCELHNQIAGKGLWDDLATEWKLRPPPEILRRMFSERGTSSANTETRVRVAAARKRQMVLRDTYRKMLFRAMNPQVYRPCLGIAFDLTTTDWEMDAELTKDGRNPKVYTIQVAGRPINDTQAIFAVKETCFRPEEEQRRVRVEREIALMKRVTQHTHVVELITSEVKDDMGRVFMEYLSGGDMKTLLDFTGPVSELSMKPILRQILLGLQFLHEKNIVHRDIKTSNLLVGFEGCIKIGDLGSAKDVSEPRSSTQSYNLGPTGTTVWMSPELARDEQLAGKRGFLTDIWSFGCVVVALLSGRDPWMPKVKQNTKEEEVHCARIRQQLADMGSKGQKYHGPPLPPLVKKDLKTLLARIFVAVEQRSSVDELLGDPWLRVASGILLPDLITRPGL